MAKRPFDVIILSESDLLKEGLVRALNSNDFTVISSNRLSSGESLQGLLPRESEVLLIVDASDDFNTALNTIKPFKLTYPNGRVAVLVGRYHFHTAGMISALQSGATAYLMSCTMLDTLIKSLELVILGQTVVPPSMLTYLLDHSHGRSNRRKGDSQNGPGINGNDNEHDQEEDRYSEEDEDAIKTVSQAEEGKYRPHLSAQQTAILQCLIDGDSNKLIARKMKIADATVKVHIKAILRKIRVENRTQAAIWAMRNASLDSASRNDLWKTRKSGTGGASDLEMRASL